MFVQDLKCYLMFIIAVKNQGDNGRIETRKMYFVLLVAVENSLFSRFVRLT